MSSQLLKQRVEARDRLPTMFEHAGVELQEQALGAIERGDLRVAQAAILRHDATVASLVETLRTYQAELHAQADELAAAQARTEQVMTRFSALFSGMPVAALLVAFNGELVEHNAQASALFAFRERGLPARFLHRLVDRAQYQNEVRPAFLAARSEGTSRLDAVQFATEDGNGFLGELHIAALPAGPGENAQFACAVIDRTEHLEDLQALHDAHAALRTSETFLADGARIARIAGFEWLASQDRVRWSAQAPLVLGLPADAVTPTATLLAMCAPGSRQLLADALAAAAHEGRPFEVELDMVGAQGRVLRALALGHPASGMAREPRVVGVLQDITHQHRERRQIDDLTERLALAADAGGIGIFDWDVEHDTVFADDRLCALFGIGIPPVADLPAALAAQLDDGGAAQLRAALQRSVVHGEPLAIDLKRRDTSGDRCLRLNGRVQTDSQGRVQRLVGCAWDCTRENEAARLLAAKDAAERTSRAKSEFLARMSHELRTPLNAILGFAQLMQLEVDAGDLTLKPHRVTLIETAARHLLDLVNEVLDVSRIESGQMEVRPARVALAEVLAECVPLVGPLAQQAGVEVTVANPGPAVVLADRLRLKEVLINLLSNAVKYNRPGGQVEVRVAARGDKVEIVVADTGRGLGEQQLGALFQPFNRLGAEGSRVEGSGMGLYVSKRFVELMGGTITVTSRPGEGTAVTLLLACG